MAKPGPNPSRQDAPHPHQALVDPTGTFVLFNDLGADQIRIYSIDQTSGKLNACPSANVTGGTGPRHGVFYNPSAAGGRIGQMLYVANELANTVSAFSVSYPASGCLTLTQEQSLSPYPADKVGPSGSKVAEVRVFGNMLYASNRGDATYNPNDSMAVFELSSTGYMTFQNLTSAYGVFPRTFAINPQGNLVAIGDQTSANIAIVTRDATTGQLGAEVANLRIGPVGTYGGEDGLSSVVWAG